LNVVLQQLKKANEELGQCQAELLQKTEQEEMSTEKVKRLDSEVISLLEQITQLTVIRWVAFVTVTGFVVVHIAKLATLNAVSFFSRFLSD